MYIFFPIFSCSLWNEPTMKIYFLSHSHTWTPLLRVHFGHARVPFGHALGHQQSSILKICKSIMPFLKKKKLNKKSSRYTKFDKKNNKQKIATAARADLFETDYNSSTIKLTADFTKKIFFREIEIFVYIIKTNNNNRLVRQNM